MKKCVYCGADLPDDAKACSNCGRPVPGMDTQNQGNTGDNGSGTQSASEVSGENGGNTPDHQNGQGYWQFGQWHPLEDLNKQQSGQNTNQNMNQNTNGSTSSDHSSAGNGGYSQNACYSNGWNQNSRNDGWNGGAQGGSWNGSGQNNNWNGNGQNNNWNGNGQNNNWNGAGQNNNWNGSGQNSGWNGSGYGGYPYGGGYGNYPNGGNGMSSNGLAVAAFIFGLLSIPFGEFFFIPCVLAIVMGIAALVQIRKNPGMYATRYKVFALIGLILGIILLVFWIIIYVAAVQLMSDPSFMKDFENYMNTYLNSGSDTSSFR